MAVHHRRGDGAVPRRSWGICQKFSKRRDKDRLCRKMGICGKSRAPWLTTRTGHGTVFLAHLQQQKDFSLSRLSCPLYGICQRFETACRRSRVTLPQNINTFA